MNFVTLHDLSRELNIPARVVRYRFHQLRTVGKLTEGDDFIREDFVDDQHFTWKINPLSYMRETKSAPIAPPVDFPSFSGDSDFGIQPRNQSVNQESSFGSNVDNQDKQFNNQNGNQTKQNISPHSEQMKFDSSLEREMITFLRERLIATDEQLKAKDSQITDLSKQNHELSDLNIRLVGQGIRQSEQIQELLKLTTTPGYQTSDYNTPADNKKNDFVNDNGYHYEDTDNKIVSDIWNIGYQSPENGNFSTDQISDDIAA